MVGPYDRGVLVGWQNPRNPWNNWTGVCAGSILAACESLAAQGFARPAARARALEGLNLYLDNCFTAGGECDEGMGYWNYGMSFASLGWSRLSEADFQAHVHQQRFRQVADYPRRAYLFGEYFYSGNDAALYQNAPFAILPWLAAASNNKWLQSWCDQSTPDYRTPGYFRHFGQMLRFLEVAPNRQDTRAITESPNEFQYLEDQQVAILREVSQDGELVAILTGGSNGQRHNHNDLGHFLIACDEQWIVPDLGWPFYVRDFFGPSRYNYLSASSRGHCCPLIGDHDQWTEGGEAKILLADAGGDAVADPGADALPAFSLELANAYPPEAGLQSWTRKLHKMPRALSGRSTMRLADTYQTAQPHQSITHVIWSLCRPQDLQSDTSELSIRLGLCSACFHQRLSNGR